MSAEPATDDGRDLGLRLVLFLFGKLYQQEPAVVWRVPAPTILLGGRDGGPTLALPTRWGVRVATTPRDDASLFLASINRPVEPVVLDLDFEAADDLPAWTAGVPALARRLRDRGIPTRGAVTLASVDLPDEAGVAATVALRCALALAMAGSARPAPEAEVLPAVCEGDEAKTASYVAALFGRDGSALLVPADSGTGPDAELQHVAFDPAAQGYRLVLMVLRPGQPTEAPVPVPAACEPDPWEDWCVLDAVDQLARRDDDGHRGFGALLTTADGARRARTGAVEVDVAVDAAMAAGAVGARATTPTTALALVPTLAVRSVRGAVAEAFHHRGLPAPRLLTTAGIPRQV